MKVWVVERVYTYAEETDEVIAVFSSEELAKSFVQRLDPKRYETYNISSWKVDNEVQ
jgi:hypothetical protein